MRFILRNSAHPHSFIFVTGFCSIGVQCLFIREALAVFYGNELILGLVLSTWLLCSGIGSFIGAKSPKWDTWGVVTVYVWAAVGGILLLRAGRLLFSPGEIISPLASLGILSVSQGPFAFVNGYVFGRLSQARHTAPHLYRYENMGNIAGSLIVFLGVVLFWKNALILIALLVPVLWLCKKKPWLFAIIGGAFVCIALFDSISQEWKYDVPVTRISCGREGEVVLTEQHGDTAWLLNNTLYRSSADDAFIEQAVHIPMAQREHARRVLVIFDKGHYDELKAYNQSEVDIIETERLLARKGSIVTSPESHAAGGKYDVILMAAGMPETMGSSRFYTQSYFTRMKSLLSDSGVFSFSLSLSSNYLNRPEQEIVHVLHSTLNEVFNRVLIFPGEGYTFMASDSALKARPELMVQTQFVGPYIMPALSDERIESANTFSGKATISTIDKPVVLIAGLQRWMKLIEAPVWGLLIILALVIIAGVAFFPKKGEMLSVGSSGFTAGIFSVALLLLYQAGYGALYSRISLLLLALTLGFALGSYVRKFPHSDGVIAVYVVVSMALLTKCTAAPQLLFYLLHGGIGFLCGAQFVTRKNSETGILYAVDLFGGVIGMVLSSTVLVPMFGVMNVALGLGAVKLLVWGANTRSINRGRLSTGMI
ncbi:MAG: hypothetical protein GF401_05735 [Chitinivibrionales bacterium]|nr:hypothetical protein [Chitinivibrionales bacterium]